MNVEDLPSGTLRDALATPHFPTRQQAFVWRNWELVPVERLAAVLSTGTAEVLDLARDLGLPIPPVVNDNWLARGHTTVLRSNWHLLPYEQLLQLLDWTPGHLAYMMKVDDGIWGKLGAAKPVAAPLRYRPLTDDERERTRALRETVDRHFPEHRTPASSLPFDFLKDLARFPSDWTGAAVTPPDAELRLIYAYGAPYGDTLFDETLEPYPDGLLARYAQLGINGIWMQVLLYTVVPIEGAEAYSDGCERRLENLRNLVARAATFGIRVYVYFNEPRGMPEAFYRNIPEWKGVRYKYWDLFAMCTSQPVVIDHLRNATAALFRAVPDLGGVISITMFEQITNCRSIYWETGDCPLCSKRSFAEIIAEINNAIEEGAHSVAPAARVIAWEWGWHESWSHDVVDALNPGVELMCTSEGLLEMNVAGIPFKGLDYSLSQVGPSEHSKRMWAHAKERGLKTHAKVQVNNTWECSAVPYIPVPFLVDAHLQGVREAATDGYLLSWTLGGYPGYQLELITKSPRQIADERFGGAAEAVVEAWEIFGNAFRNFPYSVIAVYNAPQNLGCANLLYPEPTGYTACIVGVPYDDLPYWCAPYPDDVFEEQFRKMTDGWRPGLEILDNALEDASGEAAAALAELTDVARATYCHLRTAYLQIKFVRRRNLESFVLDEQTRALLHEEIELAKALYTIMRRDSRIGFEATNHYYYTANELVEKVLNCEHLFSRS